MCVGRQVFELRFNLNSFVVSLCKFKHKYLSILFANSNFILVFSFGLLAHKIHNHLNVVTNAVDVVVVIIVLCCLLFKFVCQSTDFNFVCTTDGLMYSNNIHLANFHIFTIFNSSSSSKKNRR